MLFEKVNLEPDEQVLKIVRRHWFLITVELLVSFLVAVVPLLVLFLIMLLPDSFNALNVHLENFLPLSTFAVACWLLLSIMSGFMVWTHYYLDLWIITDRRIIVVDQIGFFHRNVSVFRLERMQDIEVTIRGFIPTLLNFGSISAQTAGHALHNFESRGMPDPRGLQAIIQKAMDARLARLHMTGTESE
ncbi:MAG: PH domain-containing protein [Patescibacteria group bacterium]